MACRLNEYRIPSTEVLQNRREFHSLWRRSDDGTAAWLKRIQNCIHRCEYPRIFMQFLLFDRFVCEADGNELDSMQCVTSLSLEHFLEDDFLKFFGIDHRMIDETVNPIENISLSIVKSESVCIIF